MNKKNNPVEGGVKIKPYKDQAEDISEESLQVRRWRQYIRNAEKELHFADRLNDADEGNRYLEGTKEANRKIYLRYLPGFAEDCFRKTLPRVPTPRIEAESDRAELFADSARELVRLFFSSSDARIKIVARQLQWDDARFGISIAKTIYKQDINAAESDLVTDPDQVASEIDRADAENADILFASINENDVDYIHIDRHLEALSVTDMMTPEYSALRKHIEEHRARMTVVKKERLIVERIAPWKFVYDTDVPWHKRGWEAERQSVRVQELIDLGYRNINPENLPPEMVRGEQKAVPYEDMTAQVWHIHDRMNDKHLVVSAQGPIDGRFLFRDDWEYGSSEEIDIYYPLVFRPYEPEQTHGLSSIQMSIPVLDNLAEDDFHINRHVRNHSDTKGLYPQGSLPSQTKAGLNNPDQRWVGVPPEALMGMKEVTPPEIPSTLLEHRELLLGELRRIWGADAQDTATEHKHRITATESSHRGEVKQDRKDERQEIMGEFLAWVAMNFLALYRRFGVMEKTVRLVGSDGAEYKGIRPSDIPKDINVYLDVEAETSESKIEDRQIATQVLQVLASSPAYPTDWIEAIEYTLRKMGVRRPEQFRGEQPEIQAGLANSVSMPQGGGRQKDFSPRVA